MSQLLSIILPHDGFQCRRLAGTRIYLAHFLRSGPIDSCGNRVLRVEGKPQRSLQDLLANIAVVETLAAKAAE
jgi:hypothetical protein